MRPRSARLGAPPRRKSWCAKCSSRRSRSQRWACSMAGMVAFVMPRRGTTRRHDPMIGRATAARIQRGPVGTRWSSNSRAVELVVLPVEVPAVVHGGQDEPLVAPHLEEQRRQPLTGGRGQDRVDGEPLLQGVDDVGRVLDGAALGRDDHRDVVDPGPGDDHGGVPVDRGHHLLVGDALEEEVAPGLAREVGPRGSVEAKRHRLRVAARRKRASDEARWKKKAQMRLEELRMNPITNAAIACPTPVEPRA